MFRRSLGIKQLSLDTAHVTARGDVSAVQHGDVTVLLDPHAGRYFTLNAVGGQLWYRLETPTSVRSLVAHVRDAYDLPEAVAADDVLSLLRELASLSLLEVH